ncbi:MAG TPA: hypothetical protein VK470_12675 [Bacteroidota bacterium]|nr:hypothetical protein [Bacteroidota bacterium]
MTYQEKLLYHQIHPLKLSVDVACAALALYFVWQHDWLWGIIIAFIPSMVASMYVLKYENLEPLKQSPLGRYVRSYMNKYMDWTRTGGLAVAAAGAWMHDVAFIGAGVAIICYTWLAGFFKRSA